MQRRRVEVHRPDGRREQLDVESSALSIGRATGNDLVLDHHGVSANHCVLRWDAGDGVELEDLGSTNGTWVGERRIEGRARLPSGAPIVVGGCLIQVLPSLAPVVPRGSLLLDDHEQTDERRSERQRVEAQATRDRQRRRRAIVTAIGSVGAASLLGLGLWSPGVDEPTAATDPTSVEPTIRSTPNPTVDRRQPDKQTFEHVVIPSETLEDIARRYDVSLPALMRWNGIDERTPLAPGQTLEVTAARRPLAQQMIVYRTDQDESWTRLAKRFDVSVDKLRAYNPTLTGEPKAGSELTVWIDPKPLVRKTDVQIPEFEVRPDAISVGAPRDGKLLNGIQFPAEDQLYKRRKPYIMWCSSHMAKHLREAIAAFRYTYEFEGEIVVADMSQRGGGLFPPHKSHQAGRDVDIWLPTLKGVYQQNHLQRDRMPSQSEADWFALYAFLEALYETGEVQQVYLDYILQDRVYRAAKLMGASDEELDVMIAYPRGAHHHKSLLQHSPGHIHHIHVRFKCGPNDQCSASVDTDPGD